MSSCQIITISQKNTAAEAAQYILTDLKRSYFFDQPAALLLSGGSNVQVAAELAQLIDEARDLSQLHVLLADERVNVAADDLNENQLWEAGVLPTLAAKGAQIHLLSKFREKDIAARTNAIAADYQQVFDQAKQIVFLAGMGDDGHTAGMLPTKQESKFKQLFDVEQLVSYYQVDPNDSNNSFTERLTINLTAMKHISKVYLYCVGEKKLPKIRELRQKTQSINQVPALSLFASAQPVTILTDQQL